MDAVMEHVTLTAPDISCGHYVATVQAAVRTLPGVAHVAADAATRRIDVDFDPGWVSVEQLEAALDEAGYPGTRARSG